LAVDENCSVVLFFCLFVQKMADSSRVAPLIELGRAARGKGV
jgi:hypothetical protein